MLLLSLVLAQQPASHKRALARAVAAYHDGSRPVGDELQALHEMRPWDDDVAYWLARVRLDEGRCAAATALVQDRTGAGLPTWRFHEVHGLAQVCLGQVSAGAALLESALAARGPIDPRDPRVDAALGVVLADTDPARAAGLLVAAGGDPDLVLPSHIRSSIPDPVLGVSLELPVADLQVGYAGAVWRVDGTTGLARALSLPRDPPLPTGLTANPGPRQMVPCGDWVWTSPAEPLDSGNAGVYAWTGGAIRQLAPAPAGAVFEQPRCAEGAVWVLQRGLTETGALGTVLVQVDGPTLDPGVALVRFDVGAAGWLLETLEGTLLWDGASEPEPLIREGLPLQGVRWHGP
jgi:hypothetical protein